MNRSILATPRDRLPSPRRPLTHYRMEWGNIFKVASLLGLLGFVTSVGSSFLLSFCIQNPFLSFIFGISFCASSFISLIVTFALKSYLPFLISTFSLGGGLLLLFVDPNYHLKANYFNRFAIYFHIILPSGLLLTSGWLIITKLTINVILQASKMDRFEELTLYFCGTFVSSFALACVVPAVPGVTVMEIASNALMWAIAVWFFAGIVAATIGILIERRGDKALAVMEAELQPATARPSTSSPNRPA
jgi:hypothetical protein